MKNQTKTKIKNAILTMLGVSMAIVAVSEVQDPSYWWIQILATLGVFIIIKIAFGGKNVWN